MPLPAYNIDSEQYSQSTDTDIDVQTKDCTGLERTISASTELFITRGESLMKWTVTGGT